MGGYGAMVVGKVLLQNMAYSHDGERSPLLTPSLKLHTLQRRKI